MSLTAPLAYKLMHYFPNTNVPPGPRTSIFTNAQDAVTLECVSFNESGNVSGGFGLGHKRRICWMGALFGAFSLGSLPCVYKGAKNDINSFMHRHFDIFVSIHTHFAVFSPPTKYVTYLRFFPKQGATQAPATGGQIESRSLTVEMALATAQPSDTICRRGLG